MSYPGEDWGSDRHRDDFAVGFCLAVLAVVVWIILDWAVR